MAQNTGAGQTFTTDNLVGRRTFIGTTTPAYPVAGDVWIDNSAGSAPNANFTTYTATGGETSVTVTYTVNYELVYLNGVKLVRGTDYIATTGTSITGLTALVANDIVEVVSFTSFLVNGAVNLSTVTAKGDILAATGNSTITNVAVGSDGSTLVADSSTSTGLRYNPTSAAGKNAIINGGMDIWQRGTSFSIANATPQYTADRWDCYFNGAGTITQETSVIPSNSKYAIRFTATATSGDNRIYQLIETNNALPYAGKAITISLQLAGTVGVPGGVTLAYSTSVDDTLTNTSTNIALTTVTAPTQSNSLQTYVFTGTVPSNAKTLRVGVGTNAVVNTNYLVVANVQLELGSTATTFSRAGGSIGGELALCQYYFRRVINGASATNEPFVLAQATTTTAVVGVLPLSAPMRTAPTLTVSAVGNFALTTSSGSVTTITALTSNATQSTNRNLRIDATVASGLTAGSASWILANSASATLDLSSEL